MKFEIKHRLTGAILFSLETESFKLCVEAAIKAGSNLSGSDLSYSNLSYSNLSYSNLSYSDLRGSNLSGSDLSYSNLSYSDLRGSNLRGSNLSGSDLRGASGLNPNATDDLRMLLDQPGSIRAYKLVKADGIGPYNGGITYEIGGAYKVANADTDETKQCGAGINLATLPWCLREWQDGYRILVAEFTAADIAAIPYNTDGKFRVHRCKIVAEKSLAELNWPPKAREAA
jgi:uncharacterized protein YjbI with pentapeptide repeats